MSLNQDLQDDCISLTNLLAVGCLDYMCQSTKSSPLTDQPGHGIYVSTETTMWTVDSRSRQIINDACELFQFNQLPVSCGIRSLLLFSAHNFVHASTEGA